MKEVVFFLGGCKSGKSRHALKYANQLSNENKTYIATCQPQDNEMKHRVEMHQKERGNDWNTVEEYLDLPQAVIDCGKNSNVILIDCLTLWITNLLLANIDNIEKSAEELIQAISNVPCPVLIVSNEVGMGIVPENKLARTFRDIAGIVNQKIAAYADKVINTVAGIPVTIKE